MGGLLKRFWPKKDGSSRTRRRESAPIQLSSKRNSSNQEVYRESLNRFVQHRKNERLQRLSMGANEVAAYQSISGEASHFSGGNITPTEQMQQIPHQARTCPPKPLRSKHNEFDNRNGVSQNGQRSKKISVQFYLDESTDETDYRTSRHSMPAVVSNPYSRGMQRQHAVDSLSIREEAIEEFEEAHCMHSDSFTLDEQVPAQRSPPSKFYKPNMNPFQGNSDTTSLSTFYEVQPFTSKRAEKPKQLLLNSQQSRKLLTEAHFTGAYRNFEIQTPYYSDSSSVFSAVKKPRPVMSETPSCLVNENAPPLAHYQVIVNKHGEEVEYALPCIDIPEYQRRKKLPNCLTSDDSALAGEFFQADTNECVRIMNENYEMSSNTSISMHEQSIEHRRGKGRVMITDLDKSTDSMQTLDEHADAITTLSPVTAVSTNSIDKNQSPLNNATNNTFHNSILDFSNKLLSPRRDTNAERSSTLKKKRKKVTPTNAGKRNVRDLFGDSLANGRKLLVGRRESKPLSTGRSSNDLNNALTKSAINKELDDTIENEPSFSAAIDVPAQRRIEQPFGPKDVSNQNDTDLKSLNMNNSSYQFIIDDYELPKELIARNNKIRRCTWLSSDHVNGSMQSEPLSATSSNLQPANEVTPLPALNESSDSSKKLNVSIKIVRNNVTPDKSATQNETAFKSDCSIASVASSEEDSFSVNSRIKFFRSLESQPVHRRTPNKNKMSKSRCSEMSFNGAKGVNESQPAHSGFNKFARKHATPDKSATQNETAFKPDCSIASVASSEEDSFSVNSRIKFFRSLESQPVHRRTPNKNKMSQSRCSEMSFNEAKKAIEKAQRHTYPTSIQSTQNANQQLIKEISELTADIKNCLSKNKHLKEKKPKETEFNDDELNDLLTTDFGVTDESVALLIDELMNQKSLLDESTKNESCNEEAEKRNSVRETVQKFELSMRNEKNEKSFSFPKIENKLLNEKILNAGSECDANKKIKGNLSDEVTAEKVEDVIRIVGLSEAENDAGQMLENVEKPMTENENQQSKMLIKRTFYQESIISGTNDRMPELNTLLVNSPNSTAYATTTKSSLTTRVTLNMRQCRRRSSDAGSIPQQLNELPYERINSPLISDVRHSICGSPITSHQMSSNDTLHTSVSSVLTGIFNGKQIQSIEDLYIDDDFGGIDLAANMKLLANSTDSLDNIDFDLISTHIFEQSSASTLTTNANPNSNAIKHCEHDNRTDNQLQ